MKVASHPDQLSVLVDFARQVRDNWPEHTDEELATMVDEMAAALRRLQLPEWRVFAALSGLLRRGAEEVSL